MSKLLLSLRPTADYSLPARVYKEPSSPETTPTSDEVRRLKEDSTWDELSSGVSEDRRLPSQRIQSPINNGMSEIGSVWPTEREVSVPLARSPRPSSQTVLQVSSRTAQMAPETRAALLLDLARLALDRGQMSLCFEASHLVSGLIRQPNLQVSQAQTERSLFFLPRRHLIDVPSRGKTPTYGLALVMLWWFGLESSSFVFSWSRFPG
ncbi:unnamed protein product [Protopolystoma xenopodis]|uniref:Uncharacterized protein n=1 Tax=Protopolystoma xenopodis TaxID=117903 RepID=A0A448XLN4_9PLAT|nr:unnamed protein product [Protopolystoma xenopodis]